MRERESSELWGSLKLQLVCAVAQCQGQRIDALSFFSKFVLA
jgi:hypothetical protein